jgi:putative transcriptional regulator
MLNLSGVGNRIEVARKRKNLSQAKLAELVGVTRVSISLYETGAGKPSNKVLHKLADTLEVPFDDLTGLDNGIPGPPDSLIKFAHMNGYRSGLIEKHLGCREDYREIPFYGDPFYLSLIGVHKSPKTTKPLSEGCPYCEWPSLSVLLIPGIDYSNACVSIIEDNAMKPRYPDKSRHVFIPILEKQKWVYLTGLCGISIDENPIIVRRIIANKETTMLLADADGNELILKKKNVSMLWRVGQTVHMPLDD